MPRPPFSCGVVSRRLIAATVSEIRTRGNRLPETEALRRRLGHEDARRAAQAVNAIRVHHAGAPHSAPAEAGGRMVSPAMG